MTIEPVAFYRGGLSVKFGIPRQSGLVPGLTGRVVFEKPYAAPEAFRGLEGFGMVWLLWGFSANGPSDGALTVRPPRLGGNVRLGVWATRSPYRPNPLGLSAVRLLEVHPDKGELLVGGADLMDGTPVFDVKPYIPYADSYPDAAAGFAAEAPRPLLEVTGTDDENLRALLALDPRPAYQDEPGRIYGMAYEGKEIHFRVTGNLLEVL